MALNETVNATLNATSAGVNSSLVNSTLVKATQVAVAAKSFIPLVFERLWELISAPFTHSEMLWIIFPLIFTLVVMEIYYDRNDDEEMGWGAALANSLVLIFVAIDLIKVSFDNATPWAVAKEVALYIFGNGDLAVSPQVLILIVFLGVLGLGVTLINYFHLLPRKIAFAVSGHPPINFLAFFAIAIVYTAHAADPIPFDIPTLVAGVVLFILIMVVVFTIKKFFRRLTGNDDKRW